MEQRFHAIDLYLRKGHRWSDGAPFTAEDVKFWYDHLALSPLIMEKPKDYVLVGGKPMTVDVVNPQTVVFNLPAPKPGLLAHFAFSFAQGFSQSTSWHHIILNLVRMLTRMRKKLDLRMVLQ